ncbi:MAG: ABC transporter ATP-binding protein [Methylobacteriaceae bacterium]|nr:ABC transporter ATP-binding protein [Methylobacteriaceae bacterium]
MAASGAAIGVENLDVAYGRTKVLHDVSLTIPAGRFVALIGSSGCGKTTLLRAISGFVTPQRGRILVDERDVTAEPPERRGMAMVFQSYALWPHMSAAQNVGYGLKLRGMGRAERARKVDEILELLRLQGFGERKVTDLSGGQRQRVALGRALAIDPPILLLDEPLSNLDAKIRLAMRHELKSLHRRLGLTAVHVTHDQEEAMVMADEIVVLDQGRIVQQGAPEDVYRRPNSSFVASFLGADNIIEGEVRRDSDGAKLTLADGGALDLPTAPEGHGRHVIQFRSDAVRLDDDAAGPALRLDGRIAQASYPGGRWRYEIDTPAGRFLVDDSRRASAGDAVRLAIPAEELHIFPR